MVDIEYIKKRLLVWQKRLGLSDWHITVCYRDARDMDQCPGKARLQQSIQHADIRLMDPQDRQKCDPADSDQELDLVHELIHVRLWAIDPEDAEGVFHICREQAVEWIAKALVETERNNK